MQTQEVRWAWVVEDQGRGVHVHMGLGGKITTKSCQFPSLGDRAVFVLGVCMDVLIFENSSVSFWVIHVFFFSLNTSHVGT